MIELKLSMEVKNDALNKAFRNGTIYISTPGAGSGPFPNAIATFNVANNATISLASPIQIAVPAGTNVNRLFISNEPLNISSATRLRDVLFLDNDDKVDFIEAGIYLINALVINLVERNE